MHILMRCHSLCIRQHFQPKIDLVIDVAARPMVRQSYIKNVTCFQLWSNMKRRLYMFAGKREHLFEVYPGLTAWINNHHYRDSRWNSVWNSWAERKDHSSAVVMFFCMIFIFSVAPNFMKRTSFASFAFGCWGSVKTSGTSDAPHPAARPYATTCSFHRE